MHIFRQKLIALFLLKEGQPKTMNKLSGAAHKGDEGGKAQREFRQPFKGRPDLMCLKYFN